MGDFFLLLLLVVLLSKSCSDCIQGIVPALVALLLPAQAVAGRSKSTVFITSLKDLLKHGGGCLTLRYVLIDRCTSAVLLFASDVMSEDSRFLFDFDVDSRLGLHARSTAAAGCEG
jgi:hypothetical protein